MHSLTLPNSLTSMTLNATSFIASHPSLVNTAEHALEASLLRNIHSHVRSSKMNGLSRAKRRKVANRRRRWFVDNIVMHHKRLHDRNRQMTIDKVRQRALEKREALKKRQPSFKEALKIEKKGQLSWSQKVDIRERSLTARDRIQSRRVRAQSRWNSISGLLNEEAN